jgi:hypothetical protein
MVAIVAHVFGVMLLVNVRALVNLSSFPQTQIIHHHYLILTLKIAILVL